MRYIVLLSLIGLAWSGTTARCEERNLLQQALRSVRLDHTPRLPQPAQVKWICRKGGADFRSRNVRFDGKKQYFSLDIAGACLPESGVRQWERTLKSNYTDET